MYNFLLNSPEFNFKCAILTFQVFKGDNQNLEKEESMEFVESVFSAPTDNFEENVSIFCTLYAHVNCFTWVDP